MKLVDEAKNWYKMFSIQAQLAAGAVLGAWQMIPEDLKAVFPPNVVFGIAMVLLALGIGGRLIKQESVTKKE